MSTSLLVRNLGLAVNGLTIRYDGGAWQLIVRFAGGAAAVMRSRREVTGLAARNGLAETDAGEALFHGTTIVRASLPPTSVQHVSEAIAATGAAILAYPTAGIVRGAWPIAPSTADLESLRALCRTGGGAFVVEAAPPELKQRFDIWGDPGADIALMRRLKAQFDPNNTLSPGRFVAGI